MRGGGAAGKGEGCIEGSLRQKNKVIAAYVGKGSTRIRSRDAVGKEKQGEQWEFERGKEGNKL